MRRTFILRSDHGFVVPETIVIDSKSLIFNPSILEEYRGKEGEEMYYKSYALTKVSDFGIKPKKWWQVWRRK